MRCWISLQGLKHRQLKGRCSKAQVSRRSEKRRQRERVCQLLTSSNLMDRTRVLNASLLKLLINIQAYKCNKQWVIHSSVYFKQTPLAASINTFKIHLCLCCCIFCFPGRDMHIQCWVFTTLTVKSWTHILHSQLTNTTHSILHLPGYWDFQECYFDSAYTRDTRGLEMKGEAKHCWKIII